MLKRQNSSGCWIVGKYKINASWHLSIRVSGVRPVDTSPGLQSLIHQP